MLDFEENDQIMVSRITLEYIVANSSEGKTLITPVWRFWLGSDDDERNFLRHKILAVYALTGGLIWEEIGRAHV